MFVSEMIKLLLEHNEDDVLILNKGNAHLQVNEDEIYLPEGITVFNNKGELKEYIPVDISLEMHEKDVMQSREIERSIKNLEEGDTHPFSDD
jgi:hypothetical protein